MARQNDTELVQAVLNGEQQAYGELYDRYAPLVRAVCYDHTKHLADAQDLAQDVFVRAYERLGSLRDPAHFGGWLVGIARLRCREWRRQRRRERAKRPADEEAAASGAIWRNDGPLEALRQQVARLPKKERLALHVFYLQGNSAEEARKIMGMSRSGFYRALDRARKRLEVLMAREREDIR